MNKTGLNVRVELIQIDLSAMSNQYGYLKKLAIEMRGKYNVTSDKISLSSMRQIYKQEGIQIDLWPHKLRKTRGAYLLIDGDSYVLLNKGMKPKEPRIFTMAHELKHHYVDHELAKTEILGCEDSWSQNSSIEIGAEIFASEFVYPEMEFVSLVEELGITRNDCQAEDVVRLKRACPAPVSYTFLVKRLEWFHFVERGKFRTTQFQKLEESLFGVPFYRRKRRRFMNLK